MKIDALGILDKIILGHDRIGYGKLIILMLLIFYGNLANMEPRILFGPIGT